MRVAGRRSILVAASLAVSGFAAAQEVSTGSVVSEKGIASAGSTFRLAAEVKVNYRASRDLRFAFNAPPVPNGTLALTTPAPHGSFEISNVALVAEGQITPDLSAKAEIHVLDLYNRNPTSSDDRVFVREAWLRFGRKFDVLRPIPETTVYVQAGIFPRASKQVNRRFENYGLWGTAVGRFEEVGVEAGGTFGSSVYWRASVTNGNPVFMRDPNAFAGDNGTPERRDFATADPVWGSGFPVFYDAKAQDANFRGNLQVGGALGFRFNWGDRGRDGVDVLGWYYRRQLETSARLRGTFYRGDIDLLNGLDFPGGVSLPLSGDEKREAGVNVEARLAGFQLFAQYVSQRIAGLGRDGYEVEAAYRLPLNGLFVSGDQPVLNWIQPVVRYSTIDNDFAAPGYAVPSATWDWKKLDFGFRLGIVRGVDLTAEYARHTATTARGDIHPDEFLTTLRVAF